MLLKMARFGGTNGLSSESLEMTARALPGNLHRISPLPPCSLQRGRGGGGRAAPARRELPNAEQDSGPGALSQENAIKMVDGGQSDVSLTVLLREKSNVVPLRGSRKARRTHSERLSPRRYKEPHLAPGSTQGLAAVGIT